MYMYYYIRTYICTCMYNHSLYYDANILNIHVVTDKNHYKHVNM